MKALNNFHDNNKEKIENLVLTGFVSYYLAQIFVGLQNGELFNNIGLDYLSFWSSGYIANMQGLKSVYDLNVQATVQQLYAPIERTGVVPTPLFPIFIIPFQLLALIPIRTSLLVWTSINIAVLLIYLNKRILQSNLSNKYLWMALLTIPVFQNIYFGQVEVWLMIFTSEFLISFVKDKHFTSGLWLGMLLLKPQMLILVLPYLFLQRAWKILFGFFTISIFVAVTSFFLIGIDGLNQMKNLWLGYAVGLQSNAPEVMMNWRMFGFHVSRIISPLVGTIFIILGSIITLHLCLPLFFSNNNISPIIPLLGIFSATLAITWHSHQHMAMTLLPFLFMLLQQKVFPVKLFKAWVFLPVFISFTIIPIAILIRFDILPMGVFGGFVIGTCMLIFNLLFIYTARNVINVYSNQ